MLSLKTLRSLATKIIFTGLSAGTNELPARHPHARLVDVVAERASESAFHTIKNRYPTIFVSAVSAYEIEQKRGRSPLMSRTPPDLKRSVSNLGFGWLAIEVEDCLEAGRLAMDHRDPWDRLLVAQARRLDCALISKDEKLHELAPHWA